MLAVAYFMNFLPGFPLLRLGLNYDDPNLHGGLYLPKISIMGEWREDLRQSLIRIVSNTSK